ncbi:hypothetical protein ACTG9Q_13355 [Actinokineospora sp. 24-640]
MALFAPDKERDERAYPVLKVRNWDQANAERYEQLASLNAEQAKAIEGLVGRQFER